MTAPNSTHTSGTTAQTIDVAALMQENAELKRQLAWFKQQLFGRKSEVRPVEPNPNQLTLDGLMGEPVPPLPEIETETVTYQRGKAKKRRADDCVTEHGLRFGADVPVTCIPVPAPELQGADADQYEIIDVRKTYRLAQRPASYEVLCYERPVLKRRTTSTLITTPMPYTVLDNSLADVSLLAGLMIDKFLYHLPLYRQHQRLQQASIDVSRATLTNLVKHAIELLRPIAEAMLVSILSSRILAMDETPVKAGNKKGGMKQAWFWPLLGDAGEIAFTFSPSRGRRHIETILQREFDGTLVSDGYSAYSSYIEANTKITHAQCWVHTRRYFLAAQEGEPDAERVLEHIAYLYRVEERIAEQALSGEQKRRQRLETSKPVVDQLFAWCRGRLERGDLLPKDPLTTAIGYTLKREHALRVFLEDPDVPLDNNHTERALRPIALGRKNWLFCWTEIGAEHVGIIQSLIATCKLQEVDPYTYLVDVLQRVAIHPAKKVGELTPRQWKTRFADNPLRSDIHRGVDPPGK